MRMIAERLWRFLDSYFQSVSILINVLLVLLAVLLHASFSNWPMATAIGFLLLMLAFIDYRLKRKHERRVLFRVHEEFINALLRTAVQSILVAVHPPIQHMRASLMLPDAKNNLIPLYRYGFAGTDKDEDIRIPIGTGSAGQAWLQGDMMMADFTEISAGGMPAAWGLPNEELSKVRPSLKSVLSVPIRAGEDYEVSAILNFDTDNSIRDIKFNERAVQDMALSFAILLSGLLEAET